MLTVERDARLLERLVMDATASPSAVARLGAHGQIDVRVER